jgi:hypothetical protein
VLAAREEWEAPAGPSIDLRKDAPPRDGFFEDHQYEAVRRRLPLDLQAAVAISHTFG